MSEPGTSNCRRPTLGMESGLGIELQPLTLNGGAEVISDEDDIRRNTRSSLRIKLTGYRLLSLSSLLGFSIAKAIQSFRNMSISANSLDFAFGGVITFVLVFLGYVQEDHKDRWPQFFEVDYWPFIRLTFRRSGVIRIILLVISILALPIFPVLMILNNLPAIRRNRFLLLEYFLINLATSTLIFDPKHIGRDRLPEFLKVWSWSCVWAPGPGTDQGCSEAAFHKMGTLVGHLVLAANSILNLPFLPVEGVSLKETTHPALIIFGLYINVRFMLLLTPLFGWFFDLFFPLRHYYVGEQKNL